MTKAIIFDCFGVVRTDVIDETYRHFGGDPDKERQFIRDTLDASTKGTLPNGSGPIFAEHFGTTVKEWNRVMHSLGENDEELLNYANELRKKYKVAMLSNVGKGGLGRFFKPGYLEQYFDEIVASGDIGYAKPEAQAYEYVADKLGVRLDECVFTDDRQRYIEGAQHVGMQTILYKNFEDFKTQLEKML